MGYVVRVRVAIVVIGLVVEAGLVACGAPSAPALPQASESSSPAPSAHGSAQAGPRADLPSCAILAKTCHARDKDSEKAHECHVLGHRSTTNDACEAKRVECLAACAGDGGS